MLRLLLLFGVFLSFNLGASDARMCMSQASSDEVLASFSTIYGEEIGLQKFCHFCDPEPKNPDVYNSAHDELIEQLRHFEQQREPEKIAACRLLLRVFPGSQESDAESEQEDGDYQTDDTIDDV